MKMESKKIGISIFYDSFEKVSSAMVAMMS